MDPDDATWFELPRTAFESLVVRPIFPDEHAEWNRLMAAHHYLGFRAIVGESLRYVAVLNNRWVALMGWGAAAFKSRHRESFIGWHPQLQWKRLSLIANNVRFLILPGVRLKNLASKVLAMNTRRLSADWQTVYGHPVLLAETFVDDRRFVGTCYRAAGWLPLGQTRGFKRNGGKYYPNDVPKTIWVRLLVPDACRLLADPVPHPELLPTEVTMNLDAVALETSGGLLEYLKNVPDFRKKRGIRHRLLSVLAVAVCAILSGARSYVAMGQWAQDTSQKICQRLGCRYHKNRQCFVAPSEPTLRRAIQHVDALSLEQAVSAWLTAQVSVGGQAIAIDGKTLRGAKDKKGHQTHLLSAFLHNQGLVLAQREVPSKSNEIPVVKPLLEPLAIAGCVVTADALHTQKETARFLVEEKHADYLFTVKDNQSTLKQDIAGLDWADFPPSA